MQDKAAYKDAWSLGALTRRFRNLSYRDFTCFGLQVFDQVQVAA